MSKLRALILDWDGTIADTQQDQFLWLKHCSEQLFHKPFPYLVLDERFKTDYNRYYSANGVHGLYDMLGIEFKQHEQEIWKAYEAWKTNATIKLFPGIIETLQKIYQQTRTRKDRAQALRIALNTTNRFSVIEKPYLENHLDHYIDTAVTREILPETKVTILTKPHVYSIEWCLDLLGCTADESVSVGDTVTDITACRTLRRRTPDREQRVATVAVTWGYDTKEELLHHKPDYLIEKPEELINVIKELGGFD